MDDLISRRAAIDAVDRERKEKHLFNTAEDGLLEARRVINTLPSAQQWIQCDINEPDAIGDYLLYRPHFWGANKGQVTVCYWNGHDWSDNYRNDAERYLPVIPGMAWMPLPGAVERG